LSESANKQIERLTNDRIKQKTAAWLMHEPSSTLRDRVDIFPPDANGEYSVKQLFDCFRNHLLADDSDSLAAQKAQLEVQRLENQVRSGDADYLERVGKLVDREQVKQRLDRAMELIKEAGEKIARKKTISGEQAQKMINSAIEKSIREIREI